ncbi:hypothetical protein U91I_01843 [alpha proteobacterium U9-1i]|nr:hypothetical protein U91I_01843 [alpha proteobacterium U9-1i]
MVVELTHVLNEARISLGRAEKFLTDTLDRTDGADDPELVLFSRLAADLFAATANASADADTLMRALHAGQPRASLEKAITNLQRVAQSQSSQAARLSHQVMATIAAHSPSGRFVICGERGVRDSNIFPGLLGLMPDCPDPANDGSGDASGAKRAGRRRR